MIASVGGKGLAQLPIDGIHYPVGLSGIKGGSLPEPGICLRDDNWFYTGRASSPPNFETFVYLQAPQLMWMTDWKILGANLGIDFEVPVIYKEASYKISSSTPGSGYNSYSVSDEHFGLGDIKLEPLLLSWHWKHFDAMTAYALWVPTGEFSAGSLVNLGDDEWTHMITLGGVWYPADKNSWAVSMLQHYEFNSSQVGAISSSSGPGAGGGYAQIPSYQKIPCSVYTLEWGISKTVLNNTDAGLFGYYQKQFTDGSQATTVYKNSEVAGIGPEISTLIPLWNLSASLRYAYEFSAYNRPQGQTLNLTLTKKF